MRKGLPCSMLLLLPFAGLQAQTDSSANLLQEVVVTANRFPQKQNTTGKVVTVISRSMLERASGMTVGDLLNRQAGVFIAGANNTPGTNQDVYLRGAATGNALILVDGLPLYEVSTIANTFDLNHFPVEQVERIEILKGAQSTAYGSDAVAGVIHIITRKAGASGRTATAGLSAGSYGTLNAHASAALRKEKSSLRAHYQHLRAQGFSSAHDSTGKRDFDRDGFRQHSASLQYDLKAGGRTDIRSFARWTGYRNDLDGGAFRDEHDFTAENDLGVAGTGFEHRRGKATLTANYQFAHTRRAYLNDSLHVTGFAKYVRDRYVGRTHYAELYARIAATPRLTLLTGIDQRRFDTDQQYLSISAFGPYETALSADTARAGLFSAFASAFLQGGGGFRLEAGMRYNRHSRFGDHLTYTLNPSLALGDDWSLFLNLSSAFKAPTLYQLFDGAVGQPALNPERSVTAEAGTAHAFANGKGQSRAVLFAREIRDGIDFDYVDYRYFNYNRQRAAGIEWESSLRIGDWEFSKNYTYVRGTVNTVAYRYDANSYAYLPKGDTTYDNLFRRPRHHLNLTAGYRAGERAYLRASARLVGRRLEPRFMAAPTELDAYGVVDLYGEYRVAKKGKLFLDLRNLLDRRYFDIAGFNTRGRNFMAGLSWSLD